MHGLHFGCGLAQCGACTVHYYGEALRCCVMPISAVAGAKVVTLEGLGTPEKPHPLQQAFIDEQAAQCGYCINGMIMQAEALLSTSNPHPTEEQVRRRWPGTCANAARTCGSCERSCAPPSRWPDRSRDAGRSAFAPRLPEGGRRARRDVHAGAAPPATRGDASAAGKSRPPTTSPASSRSTPSGAVTLYSGKVELGTGVLTALTQIVAEELSVPFASVTTIQGDTALTPNQGLTYASLSIQDGGMQIRRAAASARAALLDRGGDALGVAKSELVVREGAVARAAAARDMSYARTRAAAGKLAIKVDPRRR